MYLQCFAVEADCLLSEPLFTLDIGKVIKRVGVGRTQPQCRVVTLLSILDVSLLLQSVRQVTVRVREVRLQLDRTTVCVDCQVNQSVYIVLQLMPLAQIRILRTIESYREINYPPTRRRKIIKRNATAEKQAVNHK